MRKATKEAEQYYPALRARGVSLVPIVFGAGGVTADGEPDVDQKIRALKKEFAKQGASADKEKGFGAAGEASRPAVATSVTAEVRPTFVILSPCPILSLSNITTVEC